MSEKAFKDLKIRFYMAIGIANATQEDFTLLVNSLMKMTGMQWMNCKRKHLFLIALMIGVKTI